MAAKVKMSVFCEDEDARDMITAFLADSGDVNTSMDSGSKYHFVVSIDILWDFTNAPLYRMVEFATEGDFNIEVEIYPAESQWDIVAAIDGFEEQEIGFEYCLYDEQCLSAMAPIDRVLFQLNSGLQPPLTASAISGLSTQDKSLLVRFFEIGSSYGADAIYNSLSEDVKAIIHSIESETGSKELAQTTS